MSIDPALSTRLALPAIAAPMTAVSGPELVIAASRRGVVGSFPTHNAATTAELEQWLDRMSGELDAARDAPVAPNLVVHRTNGRLLDDLEALIRHGVELVITSVGSPAAVVEPLHGAGCAVFADVASLAHVERAIAAGVDGLVLLSAGAGGQTGWANPFAFVRAARERFDGTIVLAGGISDGASMLAARVLGADLVYLGTRLIATEESLAAEDYKAAIVNSTLDDVALSSAVGGLPASLLRSWLARDEESSLPGAVGQGGYAQDRLLRRQGAWSAGHSVSGVSEQSTVDAVLDTLAAEYSLALAELPRATSTFPADHLNQ